MVGLSLRAVNFVLFTFIIASTSENAPKVKTHLGWIKGYYKISQNRVKYQAFEGIPYALPPVGKLRFKDPEPVSPWFGEFPATKFSDLCAQFRDYGNGPEDPVLGSEDCLYLNVYAPIRKNGASLIPVIVWIHGGDFQFDSGTIYGAKYLIDRHVIVVTINYRLSILGFLSTEDEIVPGNMGLKDQVMAFRWIAENIESFGGNPKQVMLVGMSAGGASVHYHYMSPMTAGLFHAGISLSGTAFDCWTQTENSLEKAKKLGDIMGCWTNDTREMIECLRVRPVRSLLKSVREFMPWFYNPITPFGPVVEKGGNRPFLTQTPWEAINSGQIHDIPWVTSVVSEEGLYPVLDFGLNDTNLKELNDNWTSIAPHLLDFNYTIPKEMQGAVSQLIKTHYFGAKPIERSTFMQLVYMVGDRINVIDALNAARMQSKVNKNLVWFYYYSYRAVQSASEVFGRTKEDFGVCHGDDSLMIMESPYVDPTTTQTDLAVQNILLNLWTSFANNGIPDIGVEWTPVDASKNFSFLHISGPKKIKMESNPNLGQVLFWNKIPFNENGYAKSENEA